MANIDHYLPCESYAGHAVSENYPGFSAWSNESDGLWYFSVITNLGRVVLRSEGYNSEAARNNGIESVQRNRDIESRYSVVEEDGQWYVILKAGNHQEIARSCGYESEGQAQASIAHCFSTFVDEEPTSESNVRSGSNIVIEDYLPCNSYQGRDAMSQYPGFTGWQGEDGQYYFAMVDADNNVLLRSEAYTTEAARNNGIESVQRNRDIEARYSVVEENGEWFICLKAANHQEIGRSCAYESEAAALAAKASYRSDYVAPSAVRTAKANIIIEDYLPCSAYENRTPLEGYDGFTGWQDSESGLYYFAMVDNNGSIRLKSEGYTTAASRNNGVESVIRNRYIRERWVQRRDDDGYYYSLVAGNRQEIARTCHFDSESALLGWFIPFSASWSGGEYVEVESQPEVSSITVESRAIETPVIVEISEEIAPAAIVEEAVVEIPEIIPDIDESIPVGVIVEEPVVEEPKIEVPVEEIATAATAAAILPEIEVPKVEEKVEYVPQWKKKEEKTVVYTKPVEEEVKAAYVPPPPAPEVETSGGGFKWWWLLPLLLIPLFFLWKGCDGCNKPKTEMSKPTPPPPPAPVDTIKSEPPAPAQLSCNCNASSHPVFNMNNRPAPKSLKKLGTSPEFGNLHGLDGKGFYDKLKRHYNRSATDKKFLDAIFKEMGYTGFSDANPDLFREVTLTPGTVGNMGYNPTHKTIYASLDTQGKDLEAFRIKAANGCDLHFMKTCGNHFFFCPR